MFESTVGFKLRFLDRAAHLRFIENGPVLPDKLLLARDQGRVVFFCGAGVSRAYAKLDDFFGLARKVTTSLGVSKDSAALKILDAAKVVGEMTGVGGLVSADRVFGYLERHFDIREIEAAVAEALRPQSEVDLTAHRILVDLATTETGRVQLVTTNFDRLFDECRPGLKSWQSPRLPDLARPGELDGVVYLHGKADTRYQAAEGDGFVLSSRSFGRAYLADGWATEFVKSVLERFVVVFVGYGADDPPVHYLLEALNQHNSNLEGVYAFQSGTDEEAADRWVQRGVEAIAYDDANNHRSLWSSLEAWAVRARDPIKWFRKVIQRAKAGPAILSPYERGQFAHVLSTKHGAKMVAEQENPPPGEWFCVLDPARRFGKPGFNGDYSSRGPFLDPFDQFGLDSDLAPAAVRPENRNANRATPAGSWDGFALNKIDRSNLEDDQSTSFRGHWASNLPRLPTRLWYLGTWLSKVASSPSSVWWAAHQNGLHPDVCQLISTRLNQSNSDGTPIIRSAWNYLFEAWQYSKSERHRDLYLLIDRTERDGWSAGVLREYGLSARAYLRAEPNWARATPPSPKEDVHLRTLVLLDVSYPDRSIQMKVPDHWLTRVLCENRKNLEFAVALEEEINGGFSLDQIAPINASDDPEINGYDRSHGLSALVIHHANETKRLSAIDAEAAKQEVLSWRRLEGAAFERLRIWAGGDAALTSLTTAKQIFSAINDEGFWDPHYERDLLLSLASRWPDLGETFQNTVEKRILKGPAKWDEEPQEKFNERTAWLALSRLHWLSKKKCVLNLNLQVVTEKLKQLAPNWTLDAVTSTAESTESRAGWVKTDSDYAELLELNLSEILKKAAELGQHRGVLSVQRKPFSGLCAERPMLALMALLQAGRLGDYPEWAWRDFLQNEARHKDKKRLVYVIAREVLALPAKAQIAIASYTSDWLSRTSQTLMQADISLFDSLILLQTRILADDPRYQQSSIIRGDKKPDWMMEAINSSSGRLAETSFNDPRIKALKEGIEFPEAWRNTVEALLNLPNDGGRFSLVVYARQLNWFYFVSPEWTEVYLLSRLATGVELDSDAFWSGFLFSSRMPTSALFRRLKSHFLQLPYRGDIERRDQGDRLAAFFLSGWATVDGETGQPFISADEFRTVLADAGDNFRSHVLWTIERWARDEKPKSKIRWSVKLIELLKTVWPKQKTARSPRISSRLLDLTFANAKNFVSLADAVIPLLTTIDEEHVSIPALYRSKGNIASKFPEKTLALLAAFLPENPRAWPYGIETTLTRIQESQVALKGDPRLLELLRRWDGR